MDSGQRKKKRSATTSSATSSRRDKAASDDVTSASRDLKDLKDLKNLGFDLNPGLDQPPRRSSRLRVDDPPGEKAQKKRPRENKYDACKGTGIGTSTSDNDGNLDNNSGKISNGHGYGRHGHGRQKHDDGSAGTNKGTFKSAGKSSTHTFFFDGEADDFLGTFDSSSSSSNSSNSSSNSSNSSNSNSSSSSSSNSSSSSSNNSSSSSSFFEALSTVQSKLTLQQRFEVISKLEIDPLNPPYSIDFTTKHVCNKSCKYSSNRKEVKNASYNSKTKKCDRSGKLEENCFPRLIDCNPYDKNIWTVFIDADEVVIEDTDIDIEFYYPFSGSFKFPFHSEDGFTRKGIVDLIRETYCKIYISERATAIVEDDSSKQEYMNCTYTDGLFGIHSHEFEDLFLELIRYNPFTRVVSMIVGSWNEDEEDEEDELMDELMD